MLIVVWKCIFQRLLIDLEVLALSVQPLFSNTGVMFADFIECGNLLNF